MNEFLYEKETTCPVCQKKFNVTKIKSKGVKVASRDTDFCVYYEGVNPLCYDPWVCENCGYAAQSDKFETISGRDIAVIKNQILPKWKKRSFCGERSLDNAIEAFKMVLINLQARNAKSSEFAKIALRLAWLYRMKQDEKEIDFLKHALKYYSEAYEKERFPVEKLDENTCMFMIGELHRRVGNYEDAVRWLSRLISSPDARRNPTLMEIARDQYQLVKDKLGTGSEN